MFIAFKFAVASSGLCPPDRKLIVGTAAGTLCSSTSVINPILKITKEAAKETDICQPVAIKYKVSNVGTGMERNVRIEEKLRYRRNVAWARCNRAPTVPERIASTVAIAS